METLLARPASRGREQTEGGKEGGEQERNRSKQQISKEPPRACRPTQSHAHLKVWLHEYTPQPFSRGMNMSAVFQRGVSQMTDSDMPKSKTERGEAEREVWTDLLPLHYKQGQWKQHMVPNLQACSLQNVKSLHHRAKSWVSSERPTRYVRLNKSINSITQNDVW